jgi:hypothetical protein
LQIGLKRMADISGVSIGFFVRKSGNGELNGIEPYFDAASIDLSGLASCHG